MKEIIADLYYKKKMSKRSIARFLKLGTRTIKDLFNKYNIEVHGKEKDLPCMSKTQLEELYITQNKSQEEIAVLYNYKRKQIGRWLNYYNIVKPLEDISLARENTCLRKLGCKHPAGNKDVQLRMIETLHKNKTFGKSKPEERCYQLLVQKFGQDNVKRQYYRPELYSGKCDFYIITLDLWIECQFSRMHKGGFKQKELMAYNKFNPLHQERLELWKSKLEQGHTWYDNAIKTWTIRDPKKREIAKKNNLIYKEFWDEQEFIDWYNSL